MKAAKPSAVKARRSRSSPLDRCDNGRDVVLAGDAASLKSAKVKDLQLGRKLFMKDHKNVFKVLGAMQNAYCKSDERRECFGSLCHDVDVQNLTFESYMNKELVAVRPLAHLNIGIKNLSHLFGPVAPVQV